MRFLIVVFSFGVLSLAISALAGQSPAGVKTALDGVYTAEQAAKGEAIFQDKCTKCHEGDDADVGLGGSGS